MSVCVTIDGLLDGSAQKKTWYRADGLPDGSGFYRGEDGVLFLHHFYSPGDMRMDIARTVGFGYPEDVRNHVRNNLGLDPDILRFSPVAKQELLFEAVRDRVVV